MCIGPFEKVRRIKLVNIIVSCNYLILIIIVDKEKEWEDLHRSFLKFVKSARLSERKETLTLSGLNPIFLFSSKK